MLYGDAPCHLHPSSPKPRCTQDDALCTVFTRHKALLLPQSAGRWDDNIPLQFGKSKTQMLLVKDEALVPMKPPPKSALVVLPMLMTLIVSLEIGDVYQCFQLGESCDNRKMSS